MVYFFLSWHTFTKKHDKYDIEEPDLDDPFELPNEEEIDSFASSVLGSSREHLVEKV